MNVTRRDFMKLAAAGAVGTMRWRDYAAEVGMPPLRVGVLSDIHVSWRLGSGKSADRYGAPEYFLKTLEFLRDAKVDAVIIAGDLTNYGDAAELQVVGEVWDKVFPGNRRPDGAEVVKLFLHGNHDVGFSWTHKKDFTTPEAKAALFEKSILKDRAGTWRAAFHEAWSPVYMKDVKGYKFICAHWGNEKELDAFLTAHKAELAGDKPFFYAQHPHPRDTVYGDWAWGRDKGDSTAALSKFPNAIAFSGHSHFSLTMEQSIWQGAFTSIGTASLSYIGLPEVGRLRENGHQFKDLGRDLHMGKTSCAGRQGMVMDVFPDRVNLVRREFLSNDDCADVWSIPVGTNAARPFDYASRAAVAKAPHFPVDARATVVRKPGKDRGKNAEEQLVITFPQALAATPHNRVIDYEVTAHVAGQPDLVRYVYAPGFFRPVADIPSTASCVFAVSEFPVGATVDFEIRALDSWSAKSRPLTCRI